MLQDAQGRRAHQVLVALLVHVGLQETQVAQVFQDPLVLLDVLEEMESAPME